MGWSTGRSSNGDIKLMATYITLKGMAIQALAADPTNPVEGQVWYNTTTNKMKGYNGTSNVTFTSS
jgi:hypothetical protein